MTSFLTSLISKASKYRAKKTQWSVILQNREEQRIMLTSPLSQPSLHEAPMAGECTADFSIKGFPGARGVYLSCQVSGFPPARVRWKEYGLKLVSGWHFGCNCNFTQKQVDKCSQAQGLHFCSSGFKCHGSLSRCTLHWRKLRAASLSTEHFQHLNTIIRSQPVLTPPTRATAQLSAHVGGKVPLHPHQRFWL